MRTVLMVHNHYRRALPSGENRSFEEEAALLEAYGHRVVRFERASDEIETWNPARRAMVPARAMWSRESRRGLAAVIERERPDVAHFQNTFPLISPSAYGACRDAGLPVVQAVRNYRMACVNGTLFRDGAPCTDCLGGSPLPGVVHGCYRGSRLASAAVAGTIVAHRARGDRNVDLYVAPSEHVRARLVEMGVSPERIAVKPNVATPDPGPGAHGGDFALYVGRLDEEKGVGTLLDAWRGLEGVIPLRIAGAGPLDEAARATPGVQHLGNRTIDEVRALLGDARMVLVPSEWEEPFGRVVVEAFARGTPVVASAIGGLSELVDDGETGFLVPPGDAGALAAAVEKLSGDPDGAARMGRAARAAFEGRYTAERNHEMLLEIYARAKELAP